MTWLIPSALGIAGVSVAGLVALHFIARSRPMAEPLPTARFIPERAIRARSRSFALSDPLLLLLRAAAIAALGVAVAGPELTFARSRVLRVIAIDESRAVRDLGEVRDSVRAIARPGDVMVPFDSARRGSLSTGLAAAFRASASLSRSADSVQLVLISPFVREEIDAATLHLRATWPAGARLVHVRAAAKSTPAARALVAGRMDDAVITGLALAGLTTVLGSVASTLGSTVRVQRAELSPADSAWAREAGHAVVHWPATPTDAGTWVARPRIDAIGGVVSASGTLVGRFPRSWMLDGVAIARWADGEPAAVEHATGGGCIRDVAVLIDQASDLTLHSPFANFARALLAPCGGVVDLAPVDGAMLTSLAGGSSLLPAALLRDRITERSPFTPWLLALAALLLIAELAMRRGAKRAVAS
jgi:hypothetical protein